MTAHLEPDFAQEAIALRLLGKLAPIRPLLAKRGLLALFGLEFIARPLLTVPSG